MGRSAHSSGLDDLSLVGDSGPRIEIRRLGERLRRAKGRRLPSDLVGDAVRHEAEDVIAFLGDWLEQTEP